jgi:hypothetical protein
MTTMNRFDIPGTTQPPRGPGGRSDDYFTRREVHGPAYSMVISDQRQEGDPEQQLALREPPRYRRPMSVMDLVVAGAPRVLPVSQNLTHGPERDRDEEFWQGMQAAADLGHFHSAIGFHDRRWEGRRHRSGYMYEEPQQPPQRGGLQADIPFERYLGY